MNRSLFAAVATGLLICVNGSARAQSLRVPVTLRVRDSVVAFAEAPRRIRKVASEPDSEPDSTEGSNRVVGATMAGMLIGGGLGVGVAFHIVPTPSCDMCGVNSTFQDNVIKRSVAVGVVLGGLIGWYLARHL